MARILLALLLAFVAAPAAAYSVRLTWQASIGPIAAANYNVYRNGVKIGTVPVPGFVDTNLPGGVTYTYSVTAVAGGGAESAPTAASVTTLNGNYHYVRPGGIGLANGSSWANAWDVTAIQWGSVAAGDTVWIAGGTYSGNIRLYDSGSNGGPVAGAGAGQNQLVYIRWASDATNHYDAGWNIAWDAQVIVTGIGLGGQYAVVDGQVPNGIFVFLNDCPSQNCSGIGTAGPTTGLTIRYVEVSGPCGSSGCAMQGDPRSIDLNNFNGSDYDVQTNLTIQHANLHGACNGIWSAKSVNLIVEYSRIADIIETIVGCHENVIINQNTTGTLRFSEITNWATEGILSCPTNACNSSWDVYGNVWHDPKATGSFPRVVATQNGVGGVYKFYNNTFVNIPFLCYSDENSGAGFGAGSAAFNNLYIGNNFAACGFPAAVAEDYAYSDQALTETHGQGSAANPFISSSNFRLKFNTNAGIILAPPYNTDFDGYLRSTWSRGAYEFR